MDSESTAAPLLEHVPGRFRAVVDGSEVAVLDYRPSAGIWDMVHTYADPRFRGTGLASALVTFAMDAARDADVQVIPSCPYLPVWLRRHPDYADLVIG